MKLTLLLIALCSASENSRSTRTLGSFFGYAKEQQPTQPKPLVYQVKYYDNGGVVKGNGIDRQQQVTGVQGGVTNVPVPVVVQGGGVGVGVVNIEGVDYYYQPPILQPVPVSACNHDFRPGVVQPTEKVYRRPVQQLQQVPSFQGPPDYPTPLIYYNPLVNDPYYFLRYQYQQQQPIPAATNQKEVEKKET